MRYFLSLLGCLLVLSAAAQQMRVEDFTRYKHPFWQKATYETDKRQALLDLFTNEKGFQFFVGKTAVTAIEGEGLVTISLPHRTTSVTIKHPSYGQLVWKIPGKGVKRKKRYRAYLYTESVEKEYQQENYPIQKEEENMQTTCKTCFIDDLRANAPHKPEFLIGNPIACHYKPSGYVCHYEYPCYLLR